MLEMTRGRSEAIAGSDLLPDLMPAGGLLSVAGPGRLLVPAWSFADASRE